MTTPSQPEKPKRRISDSVLLLLIVFIGFCCMLFSGEMALRLAPIWSRSDTNMNSGINPDANYVPGNVDIEPLLAEILTPPVWWDVFLTPGAEIPANSGDSPQLAQETAPPPTDVPVTDTPPTNVTPTVVLPTVTPPIYPPPPSPTKPKPPPPNPTDKIVDLSITKTDGAGSYTANSSITYTVVVTNNGSQAITGVGISDAKPSQVTTWGWCVGPPCTPAVNASATLTDTFNLAPGASRTYSVLANISPSATGPLENTATLTMPSGFINSENNSATDTNTWTAQIVDLDVTKTSGNTTYTAGGTVTYSITVTNNGFVTVPNATLSDAIPVQVASWGWCEAPPTPCTPSAPQNTDLSGVSFTLAPGNSITYEVTATIMSPLTAANLVNTATVTLPAGFIDSDTGNNTDTGSVTIPPNIDLSISKNSSSSSYAAGQLFTLSPPLYVVTVTNNSTFNLTGVNVSDPKPSQILGWLWTCTASNATCTSLSSDIFTDFSDTVNMQAGGSITYSVGALIVGQAGDNIIGNLENKATVSGPTGFVDSVPGNNTSPTVYHYPSNTSVNIGVQDGTSYNPGDGNPVTYLLPTPITRSGDGTPDFVYYEWLFNPTTVLMDWVRVEISTDKATWYTVFLWGDNVADTNTNVNINSIGGNEDDNRSFTPGSLYQSSGVTIDIDGIVPSGNYWYIRITAPEIPPGSGNYGDSDGLTMDAIKPYYP